MQSGPGIFKGDLYFYRVDGDLREQLGDIDTSVCPLFLLTGEYDPVHPKIRCEPWNRFLARRLRLWSTWVTSQ